MNYKKEVQEILTQIRFTKNRLAGVSMEMDSDGVDPSDLDEALEALDDVIDVLADFQEIHNLHSFSMVDKALSN